MPILRYSAREKVLFRALINPNVTDAQFARILKLDPVRLYEYVTIQSLLYKKQGPLLECFKAGLDYLSSGGDRTSKEFAALIKGKGKMAKKVTRTR